MMIARTSQFRERFQAQREQNNLLFILPYTPLFSHSLQIQSENQTRTVEVGRCY